MGEWKENQWERVKCFLSSVAPASCTPPQQKKNQWRAVFYEIKLLAYNGCAYQHNPGTHILLHFPSFNG